MVVKLTDVQRREIIATKLAQLSPEERKKVTFILPLKKPKVEGVRIIDPKTGRLGQSIFTADQPGTRFIVVDDPGVIASRQRLESKEERAFAARQKVIMREEAVKLRGEELKREAKFRPPVDKAKKIREDTQREKVAKLILAEQRARGTKAEPLIRQRRIEGEKKLGDIERKKAVVVRFSTAGGEATIQAQVFPKKFREDIIISKPKEVKEVPPIVPELTDILAEKQIQQTISTPPPRVQVDVSTTIQKDLTIPQLTDGLTDRPIQQTVTIREKLDLSKFFTELPVSEIRAAPKPEGFLEEKFETVKRLRFQALRERAGGRITSDVIGTELLAGVAFSLLLTGAGVKELVTKPGETIAAAGVGIKLIGSRIISGEGFPEIGQIIRQEPGFAFGFVVGEIVQARVGGEIISAVSTRARRLAARVTPGFRPVETGPLGIQEIKGVKLRDADVDIGLIPKGKKGLKLDVGKIDDIIKQVDIPLAKRPAIPRVSPEQRQILSVIKERKDVAGGSFAQRTLLERQFTRPFADIDIAAISPSRTASVIKSRLGGKVKIQKLRITDSPVGEFDIFRVIERRTGKVIADVDPLKFVEEGLAARFKTTTVAGIEFIDPQARLIAKARQLARGKTKGGKVAKDITALTGGKVRLDTPLTRGGFGFTQAEQRALIGKRGAVTTSARDFFKVLQGDDVIIGKEGLFATPFDPKTLQPQTRITRLGLEQRRATLIDILTGDFTFKRQKPQIILFPEQTIGKTFKITPGEELEVLASGGQIVRKQGRVGTTIINKKIIPIFEADIGTSSKELELLTRQARTGKISVTDRKRLSRLLTKETGFDASGAVITQPLIDITDTLSDVFRGVTKAARVTKRVRSSTRISRLVRATLSANVLTQPSLTVSVPPSISPSIRLSFPPSSIPSIPPSTPSSFPPSIPTSFPPSAPPSIPPSVPPIVPPITPPPGKPPPPLLFGLPEFQKEERQGYNVFVKSKGKFKKVNQIPLTRNSALGRGAFLTDHSTAAQFKIVKSKTDKAPKRGIYENYFDFNKFKFRAFRRRLKREKGIIGPLPQNQFIERRTHRIDTLGEEQGLSLAKLLKRGSLFSGPRKGQLVL